MFVPGPKTPEQLEALALTTYIDDLTRRLENREYELEGEPISRQPSPPPEYNRFGKRTNTREQRFTKELEIERTLAVYKALELIPNYAPPPSFTKLTPSTEKYYLPVRKYPHINFIGLLLGPRGNNLRRMETESGAKISIRGRGSVKDGGRSAQSGSDEDLHCAVTAISPEKIQRAFELIREVVDTAVDTPEHQNDFKRLQLRQLAELNGTLRDYENQLCSYCQRAGHRKYACPQRQAKIDETECRSCKTKGHLMKDCPVSDNTVSDGKQRESVGDSSVVEDFLTEIGETAADDMETGAVDPNSEKQDKNFSGIDPTHPASVSAENKDTSTYEKEVMSPSLSERPVHEEGKPVIGPPGVGSSKRTPLAPPGIQAGTTAPLQGPPGLSKLGKAQGPARPPPALWKPPTK